MSDKSEPPPRTVVTDLRVDDARVAHLTRAVTRRGSIRFEFHVSENDSAADLADDLLDGLSLTRRDDGFAALPLIPGERFGPISVHEDKRDKSKVVVVYKPDRVRIPSADMPGIIGAFEEMEIPMTSKVREGIQHAFAAFDELRAQEAGHAAAEAARRSAKKGPGGPER